MIPVILAGGSGTRLWPLSRAAFPKQFLALDGKLTMLQQTVARLHGLTIQPPVIICNDDHRFLVADQLLSHDARATILLEPVSRNTAPAIALAAFHSLTQNTSAESPVLLVLAADHVIRDTADFQQAVVQLLPDVKLGKIGMLGIVPTDPDTGYGYIRAGVVVECGFAVEEFIEKPDLTIARKYVSAGDYYWNSGIFVVRADRYLELLQQFRPDIYAACELAMANVVTDLDFVRVDAEAFKTCPEESVDYAIMEPLADLVGEPRVVMVPLDAGWSDVGSWSALWGIAEKDTDNNAVMGEADVILQNTNNSFVYGDRRLVTMLGVDDLIVVDTPDVLLVAGKEDVHNVKNVVADIKLAQRKEYCQNREVYRPWGKYDLIDKGARYQVKRVTVKPGGKLSMQMHHHRAEHWVVVSGTARVTSGERTYLVTENESAYIPVGQVHALENPGVINLEMIEVQSGSYLGEDDIVRFADLYGRA